jgi:hypothetical protein
MCSWLLFMIVCTLLACEKENPPQPVKLTATSTVVATVAIPSATPVATELPTPTIRADEVSPASPLAETEGLEHFRGTNPYYPRPLFDVWYDPAQWEFTPGDDLGHSPRLTNRYIPSCVLRLQAGPLGAPSVPGVRLADRDWFVNQVQAKALLYATDEGSVAFFFGLTLPDDYSSTVKSSCEIAAEAVINTFRVVPEP